LELRTGESSLNEYCDLAKTFHRFGVALNKYEKSVDSIYFEISFEIRPGAKIEKIQVTDGGSIKIHTMEKPVEGAANKSVIKKLSKSLGIPKSNIEIISGVNSRSKNVALVFQISKNKTIENYIEKISKIF
jgi:uncharacterized protein